MDEDLVASDETVVWIEFDTMEAFMRDVFVGLGVPDEDARICADVVITADKRGIDSHGIGRMKPFYYDRIVSGVQKPRTDFEVIREGPTTAVIDGHDGMGQVIAHRAMALAMEKARKLGMGMTVVKNSWHYGIAGYYPLMAAAEDMIGISGTNARPLIAPTFGVQPMYGTNPLAIGLPSDEDFPFVIDCATSATQRGKLEVYDRANRDIPEGWAIGQGGESRIDTRGLLEDFPKGMAAMTPLGGVGELQGGHKGYGYGIVVEILSSALQGGAYLHALSGLDDGEKVPCHLGHFFMAVDVGAFTDPDRFKSTVGDILRQLRSSKKAPGHNRIYTAGEKEYLAYLSRKDRGVPVNGPLQKDMIIMRDELGLEKYTFPFE